MSPPQQNQPQFPSKKEAALFVVRRLQEAGFPAYWVGGCVRDMLMGREPQDYDVATAAVPDQVQQLFPKTVEVGKSFGVIRVVFPPHEIEVSTFRAEEEYTDGRHPSRLRYTTNPQEDAQRRDFTVNGLFYDPITGQLYDWVNGQADLRQRRIRTIGNPYDRFNEDYLRILRAVRFAAQLDFQIEPQTWQAIQTFHTKILQISWERIRDELRKLFTAPHAARGLDLLRDSGLLNDLLPEIAAFIGCTQPPNYHPEGDLYAHVHLMLQHLPQGHDPLLPWTVLLHDVGKPVTRSVDAQGRIHFYNHDKVGEEITRSLLRRLRFSNAEIETVAWVVRRHMVFKDVPHMRPAKRRELLLHPHAPLLLELYRLDCLGSHQDLQLYHKLIQERQQLLSSPDLVEPLLRGRDLLALGMSPGPGVGKLLRLIREKQLAQELTTREQALAFAKAYLQNQESLRKDGTPNDQSFHSKESPESHSTL